MRAVLVSGNAEYVVEADQVAGDWQFTVPDGSRFTAQRRHKERGTIAVSMNDEVALRVAEIPYVRDGDHIELFFGGRVYRMDVAAEDAASNHRYLNRADRQPVGQSRGRAMTDQEAVKSGVVTAPMVGSVAEILVAPGDTVEAGQPIATISAMKVYVSVPAPIPGVVKQILTRIGALVGHGERIALIERDDSAVVVDKLGT